MAKSWDLYDVSGKAVIESDKRYLQKLGYSTKVVQRGSKGYYSIYCSPKFKKGRNGPYASAPRVTKKRR